MARTTASTVAGNRRASLKAGITMLRCGAAALTGPRRITLSPDRRALRASRASLADEASLADAAHRVHAAQRLQLARDVVELVEVLGVEAEHVLGAPVLAL